MVVMNGFMKTFRCVVFLMLAIALSNALTGCTSGSNTSPTLPSQIPIAVEYAGETIAGDISVETGQTAFFTVTDSDGNTVDPTLVTAEVAEPSASLSLAKELLFDISLGAFSTEGEYIVYTADDYLPPNQFGQITAQFSFDGEVIGTSYLKISPSLENNSRYKFTDAYTTENETAYSEVGYPDIATDGLGNIFLCFIYEAQVPIEGSKNSYEVVNKIVLKKGSYSESGSIGITWQENEWTTTTTEYGARFCNVAVYNESGTGDTSNAKVALIWEYYAGSRSNGSSELVTSSDGGRSFGDPTAISYSVYRAAFDQTGKIHMAAIDIEGCSGNSGFGVKYLLYNGSTVTDQGTVNTGCWAGNENTPAIAVSSDGETAWLIWSDFRESGQTPPVSDTYTAIVKSSGVTEIKLRPDTCESAACLGGKDLVIGIDRLGQPIASWNEFTTDTWPLVGQKAATPTISMKTYLAVLNLADNQPAYTLLATTSGFDLSQPLFFSRNSAVADYANNYHVFFRDQSALRYVMMVDGQTTTPIVPTDEAIGNNGYTSAAADRSGRTYLVWQTSSPFSGFATLAIGTSSQLLE